MPKGREDLTGRMFGRWKVIGPAEDYIRPDGYKSVKGNIDGKLIKLTAFMNCKYYDHIDRNSLNNRRYNLRPATTQENNRNHSKSKRNTSGYTGVYWNKANKKWCSNIRVNNKTIYLGSFDLIEDAVKSRKEAEQKYFGEFSPQNIAI